MKISFNDSEIEKWARFSGDFNPIHFNEEAARRLDMNAPVVHGMLVLMFVKQKLREKEQMEGVHWTQFKSLLKSPVLRDAVLTLNMNEQRPRNSFRIMSHNLPGKEHVIGEIRGVPAAQWESRNPVIRIPAGEVSEQFTRFRELFGSDYSSWSQLDALIYSHFMRSNIRWSANELCFDDFAYRVPNLSDHLLVQFSHQVTFCSDINLTNEVGDYAEILYQMDNFSLIKNTDAEVGLVNIGVFLKTQHVMTIELGWMLKINFNINGKADHE